MRDPTPTLVRLSVGYLSCSLAQAMVSALPPRMMSVPRAGHVRGDRHGPEPSPACDDFRLAFVMLGVQDGMVHSALFEERGEPFRSSRSTRADKHGKPLRWILLDLRTRNRLAASRPPLSSKSSPFRFH